MEIRPLDAQDRAIVVELWSRADLTRPWNPPEEDFDRAVGKPNSAVLGGFESDRLVAAAMVGHDGHRGWVYYLGVDPDVRHRGHGRAMMAAAEMWVREAGMPKIQLMVRSSNAAAFSFYAAIGFEPEDTTVLSRWFDSAGTDLPRSRPPDNDR